MRMGTRWFWVASGLVGVASCVGGDATPEQHQALLVLDREAREAGITVDGIDGAASALPVAVSTDAPVTLVGDFGTHELDVADGEVVLVRGAAAAIERHVAGDDVDPDRIVIEAPEDVVADVADALGAAATVREDGLVEIEAPNVLWDAAATPSHPGVVETTLVEREARTVRAAAPTPRPRAPWAQAVRPAQPIAPVVAESVAMTVLRAPTATELAYRDLPPAVTCEDSVAGTWIARRHFADQQDWYFFTMKIDRGRAARGGETLRGEILAHSWNGGSNDVNTAQACAVGGQQWVVRMPATGRVHDGRLEFGGTSWSVAEHTCGWAPGEGEYNLDRFSGPVAATGETTWSNDDGGRMIDEPFEFRRISCGTH